MCRWPRGMGVRVFMFVGMTALFTALRRYHLDARFLESQSLHHILHRSHQWLRICPRVFQQHGAVLISHFDVHDLAGLGDALAGAGIHDYLERVQYFPRIKAIRHEFSVEQSMGVPSHGERSGKRCSLHAFCVVNQFTILRWGGEFVKFCGWVGMSRMIRSMAPDVVYRGARSFDCKVPSALCQYDPVTKM